MEVKTCRRPLPSRAADGWLWPLSSGNSACCPSPFSSGSRLQAPSGSRRARAGRCVAAVDPGSLKAKYVYCPRPLYVATGVHQAAWFDASIAYGTFSITVAAAAAAGAVSAPAAGAGRRRAAMTAAQAV